MLGIVTAETVLTKEYALENQLKETASVREELISITRFSPVAWVPLIGLLLMAVLTFILLTKVVNRELTSTFAEFLARLTWSISVLFFALTVGVTFVTSFQVIGNALRSVKLRISYLVLFLAAGVVPLLPGVQKFEFNVMLLGGTVYKVAPPAAKFVTGVQVFSALALAALAIAVSLVLSRAGFASDHRVEPSVTTRVASLAKNLDSVRKLLYIGALALVAGTLEASALYSWANSMLPIPGQASTDLSYYATVKDLPQVMGMLNGLFYSILLAVIFAPAFIQLRGIADRLVNEAKPNAADSERNQWLKDHAVAGSVPQQLFSALAVLSPTLAGGPLTILLGMIAPT